MANWILKRVNDTRRIGAVCTGIYGVAPTGLLNGREVTTHWRLARDLAGGSLFYESVIGSLLFETAHTIRLPDLVVV